MTPGGPLLKVDGLIRRFGGLTAVDGVSFELRANEILGLIGPNGAGKSTIFNLLSGVYRPHGGRLELIGEAITGKRPAQICRRGLTRTFQHDSMLRDMSVHDNLTVACMAHSRDGQARAQRIEQTAALLGLDDVMDEPARSLPHGRQRLLSIAIAFATRPRVMCLDEPLTGLNPTEVTATLQLIRRMRDEHDIAILFVEHNMRAVMTICDRIVVVNHGRLLAEGKPEQIRHDPQVIEAYLGRSA